MTTQSPTLDGIGSIQETCLGMWSDAVYALVLRAGGTIISYVKDGTVVDIWQTPVTKRHLAVAAYGSRVYVVFEAAKGVFFGWFDLATRQAQVPVRLWSGTSPTIGFWRSTRIVVANVDSGIHVRRTSKTLGATWSPAVEVDAGSLSMDSLDLSLADPTKALVQWAETDEG